MELAVVGGGYIGLKGGFISRYD